MKNLITRYGSASFFKSGEADAATKLANVVVNSPRPWCFKDIEYVSTELCGFAKFPTSTEIDVSIENAADSDKNKYLEFLKHCIVDANSKITKLCFLQECEFAIDDDDVLKLCTGRNFQNMYLLWYLDKLKRDKITVFKQHIILKGVGGTIEVFYMDNSSPRQKCTVKKEWSLHSKLNKISSQIKNNPDFKFYNHCKDTYGELFTSMFNFKVATAATPSAPVDITASCSDDDE